MAHKCEWCSFTVAELEAQEAEYTREIAKCDAEIERVGGSPRCAPEDKDRVDELNGQAAAHEEDRAILRNCLEARRP
jgi:hypothetical protein